MPTQPRAAHRAKSNFYRRHGVPVRLVTYAAACAAVVSISAISVGTGVGLSAPTAGGCPRWTAVLAPGTGETAPTANPTQPVGMLKPIGDGLMARYRSDIDVRYLPYPAAPVPYRNSESGGVTALSALLGGLCSSTRVVMAGYSQGADVVGDQATAIGHGHGVIPANRVVAVGLISDPRRDPRTPQLGDPVGGQGLTGLRDTDFGALTGRVRTVCVHGDLYCSVSPKAAPALTAMGRAFSGDPTLGGTVAGSSGSTGQLDPSTITRQVIIVLAGLAGTAANIPAIVNDLAQLPPLIASANIAEVHRISGDLNNLFNPLVQMAARVDLKMVSRALAMAAPLDTSGWTGVAAQIVGVLAGFDINRIAADVGIAQEVAWRATEKLAAGDPIGGAIELTDLVPVAFDLTAAAAAGLAGSAGIELAGLASTFTATTDPATTSALTDLARQGGDAARFFTSGVHQTGYDPGVRQTLDWLTSQIDHTR